VTKRILIRKKDNFQCKLHCYSGNETAPDTSPSLGGREGYNQKENPDESKKGWISGLIIIPSKQGRFREFARAQKMLRLNHTFIVGSLERMTDPE
jgi:hypothetical protein